MSIAIYQASVVSLGRTLENLKNILAKGAAHAENSKIEPLVLTNMRLYPDMLPLYKQVHIATSLSGRCVARLAAQELPEYKDTEESFPELIERVTNTITYIAQFKAQQLEAAADKEIEFQAGGRRVIKARGQDYLLEFILPNVYFHVTTTYNILRHGGVVLGKKDYTGDK